ncbi:MAG: HNH endonuclease [Lachnospiraceae bacterium]|nr:HNH endonuclease [Ruminococcus sp.]MCM1274661.1 HNH endonuclease [Lachnospiraceae bacterium]
MRKGYPLNTMYWSKTGDDTYEVLDGQQRTISIAQYVNGDFPVKINGNDKFFHNLTQDEKDQILNYELTIYVCDGDEAEKLKWFKIINIAGEVLTPQELLNATYAGSWLTDAKIYFSGRNCVAGQMADGYIKGNPIRQDYLEKALAWIADRDNLTSGQLYMATHQHDKDANDLWLYFQSVIDWAKRYFPSKRKGVTDAQEWGLLYNRYRNESYNTNELEADMKRLLMDDDVTKKAGIVPYLLSERTAHDERLLSIRSFTDSQKRRAYEKQNGICPICGQKFEFEDMQGDHITPWCKGGRTIDDNLQMLCKTCNNDKSGT